MKEIIITSSVLILCIMLIRVIFKGKISSRLQYALWILVALRLMIPASAQIYMAIGSIDEFRIMDLTRMAESKVGDVTEQLEQPVPVKFAMSINGTVGELAADYILENDGDPLTTADGPTSVFYAGTIGFTWLDILRGIWIGGMMVVALWMIITNIVFARELHKGRKEFVFPESLYENLSQDEHLSAIDVKASEQSDDGEIRGAKRKIKVYTIGGLASPCLYGVPFRESVYLTQDIVEDKEKLRHVLTHEMCHKKHGDSFWSILRSVLLIIYWMNPLVWVAAVLSKRDCELACDEEALLMLGEEERIPYGETLLSIITRKGKLSDIACTATTMTGSGKSVKERIKYIADKPRVLGVTVAAVLVLVTVVSVLVFTKSPLFHGTTWEGETTLTAGDMQITLPETIAGISGYEMNDDGDIIIYQVASGEEVGRFCEVSYGEAVLLVEQGRKVIPIGDYGRNSYLEEYMRSLFHIDTTTTHTYTPTTHIYIPNESTTHNYYAPDNSADDSGVLYHEDRYYYEPGSEGIPGTDSNNDDTTYIIEDKILAPEDMMSEESYSGGNYHIPSPQDSNWEIIPLSEQELELEEEIKHRVEELERIEEELVLQAEQEAERELQEREQMYEELIKQLEEEIEVLRHAEEEMKRRTGGVLATEDMYSSEEIDGSGSIDDDTTYIIVDGDASATPPLRESIHYPTEEIDGVESTDYPPEEIEGEEFVYYVEDSVEYLPNEEIIVTDIPSDTAIKCYIYVKGDYSGVKTQYLQELNYIDSVLRAVLEQVIVVESD